MSAAEIVATVPVNAGRAAPTGGVDVVVGACVVVGATVVDDDAPTVIIGASVEATVDVVGLVDP